LLLRHRADQLSISGLKVNSAQSTAMFDSLFVPDILRQDPAHCLGGGAEEMAAIVPSNCSLLFGNPQPGLVDEGSGLERLASSRSGEFCGSQPAQFIVNQGEQLGSVALALLDFMQNASYLRHKSIHCSGRNAPGTLIAIRLRQRIRLEDGNCQHTSIGTSDKKKKNPSRPQQISTQR
jgi:hypothetical protein